MFILEVCRALGKNKVGYAVVGGYAVALHGAVRGTIDLDLVLSLNEKSFITAEQVFNDLGLQSKLPVNAKEVFHFRKEYIQNKNLIAWSFFDPIRPAHQLDIIITHDQKKMKTDFITVRGVKICVASIPDLIQMKSGTGRPQDKEDVRALQELSKNEKN